MLSRHPDSRRHASIRAMWNPCHKMASPYECKYMNGITFLSLRLYHFLRGKTGLVPPTTSRHTPISSHSMAYKPLLPDFLGTSKHRSTNASYLRAALRVPRLQLLPQLTRLKRLREERKVALYQYRPAVSLHALIHLLPLAATITLVLMNFKHAILSLNISNTTLTALQFISKFLEMLVQASIVAVLMGVIRMQVLSPNPLGLVQSWHLTGRPAIRFYDPWSYGERSPRVGSVEGTDSQSVCSFQPVSS